MDTIIKNLGSCLKRCFFLTLLFIPVMTFAQSHSKADQLDKLFQQLYKNKQFNGAVLVAENGKPIYEKAMGFADVNRTPLQLNSQFSIAQLTRQFTTMAMMMLEEQGKINFSDHVKKYIPGFPYEGITLYHLMTFTDGLPYTGDLEEKYREEKNTKTITYKDVVNLLVEHKPKATAPPGVKLGWAGTNSIVMAYIIEKVSGESYATFLKKYIFQPLGMKNTMVYSAQNDHSKMKERAHVIKYAMNGNDLLNDDDTVSIIAGDVGVYSTLSDMLKWDQSLYTEKLVSKSMLQKAFTPAKDKYGKIIVDDAGRIPGLGTIGKYHYGFGWDLDTLYGGRAVFHAGFPPNGSFFYRNTDKGRTVIILSNNSTENGHFYYLQAFDCILKILNDQPFDFPKMSIADKVGSILVSRGTAEAIAEYHQLKQEKLDLYNFNNPQDLIGLGNTLLEMGKPDDALAILKLNATEFSNAPFTYFLIAKIYMKKGDYASAKAAVERVLKAFPNANPAQQMLKVIEMKMKEDANQ